MRTSTLPQPPVDSPETLRALVSVLQAVSRAGLDLEEVMRIITRETQAILQCESSAVALLEGDVLVYRAGSGIAADHLGLRFSLEGSLSGHCVRAGRLLNAGDCDSDPRVDHAAARVLGARSMIAVPLKSMNQVVGVLNVLSTRPEYFGPLAERTLTVLADSLGGALANAELFEARTCDLREAIRTRDEFLSLASHELKTPLTSLKLQTALARRRLKALEVTPDISEAQGAPGAFPSLIAQTERSVDRLTRLVEDMLEISRIMAGKLTLRPESLELGALVQEALERHKDALDAAGCVAEVRCDAPAWGCWDRLRLKQVVLHLLSNATKYGAGKPVQLSLSVDGRLAELRVRDQGRGIAASDHERIFQRFERAVSAGDISGLGLGLYLVRHIVSAHQGTVRVESELGRGATFVVSLPLGD